MGAGSRGHVLVCTLSALLAFRAAAPRVAEASWTVQDMQQVQVGQQLGFQPPLLLVPSVSPLNPAHNGRVCSAWGDFHYKTFDGAVFRFPGLCNYVLSAHCGAAYEDFNLQLRRARVGGDAGVSRVVLRVQGLVLELDSGSLLVDGRREELPYSRAGLLAERSSGYLRVSVRLVLTFMWDGQDSILLELDPKYANQTCGLCGDFNGLPDFNEFFTHNTRLTPLQFGNLQKLDGPTEQCQDPLPEPEGNCSRGEDLCFRTLLGSALAHCSELVEPAAYLEACAQDVCSCTNCPCATFAEYARQCAHAGGRPGDWRGPQLCPARCPAGMEHRECGSPCANTCSNPERAQLCEEHCVAGCFCPPGTVLDDVSHAGCVPLEHCPCSHGGLVYSPGTSFNASCSTCTCAGGRWQCLNRPCPGFCSLDGGSHVSTYDEKLYDLHGDCTYILSKQCMHGSFSVLAELRRCGLTDTETCLKSVTLSIHGGDTSRPQSIQIQSNGAVFIDSVYTRLPYSAGNVTVLSPTSFYVMVHTGLGLQVAVQVTPLMQVTLRLDPSHRGQTCGLCGNFNHNQADDFRALSGVVEGTAAAFANTWKTQASCPNVKNSYEDPCSLSVENEHYARHWCARLTDPTGAFASCHAAVNPTPFHSNCMFDTCNCEKSEDCLCAALSSYVRACASRGVLLQGWRDGVCAKYSSSCPESQSYAYVVDGGCLPTCRALGQADTSCPTAFLPVDGCVCPEGTFLDEAGTCVPAAACPCYFRGSALAPGEVVHDSGAVCSCAQGKLSCMGISQKTTECAAPMVYLDCRNTSAGTPGAECLRSCHSLDVECFSTHCVSGCVCPPGLVADGSGGCVAEEDCPCLHNEASYRPGDTIRVDCNTCTCRGRRWECTRRPCLGTCVAYGDGHVITFDGTRYSFQGSCEYTLAQDHCGDNITSNGTFRVVTENVPCGTTGVTCSKAIKLFLESYELILQEGTQKVVQRGPGTQPPYQLRYMGIYLVVETSSGLVVAWDRKTSVFIRLSQAHKGRVCGLCGNFDDNALNDFTTRSRSVVGSALEFGNSWKFSPSCPDAPAPREPCSANPYRKAWAQRQCSLINSAPFAACRAHVDSAKYYEACVSDACACDAGGDCECFCTAVAAYAQACRDAGVCVSWRTPDICPLFCDYYNPEGQCEWHYQPCGAPCLRTCRNPSGRCLVDLPGLEGCYPKCPPSEPFFSEDQMKCVAQCGCYDQDGNYHEVGGKVPTEQNCQRCNCTAEGIQCTHSLEACTCTYEGRSYGYDEVIYNTTDGLGACLLAVCGDNGTIVRRTVGCPGAATTAPFTFTTTTSPTPTSTGQAPTATPGCVQQHCWWTDWYSTGRPEPGPDGGDVETLDSLRRSGLLACEVPQDVQCRARMMPDASLEELGQRLECSAERGLTCLNREQLVPLCHDYELRLLCCELRPCATSPPAGSTTRTLVSTATIGPPVSTTTRPLATTTTGPVPSTKEIMPTTAITKRPVSTTTTTGPQPSTKEILPTTATIGRPVSTTTTTTRPVPSTKEILPTTATTGPPVSTTTTTTGPLPSTIEILPTTAITGRPVSTTTTTGSVSSTKEILPTTTATTGHPVSISITTKSVPSTKEILPSTTATTGRLVSTTTTTGSLPSTIEILPTTTTTGPPVSTSITTTGPLPSTIEILPTTATTGPPVSTTTTTTGPLPSTIEILPTTATTGPPVSTTTTTTGPLPSTIEILPTTTTTGPLPSTTEPLTFTGPLSTRTTGPLAPSQSTPLPATLCQPRCTWTEWFDVDYPKSEEAGGDFETYDRIRAAGGTLCEQPQDIQCRAENYEDQAPEQLGQRVHCDLNFGLVCRNAEQPGRFKMCYNYRVRVLCCSDSHCRGPATTAATAATATTATTAMVTTMPSNTAHKASTPATHWSPSPASTPAGTLPPTSPATPGPKTPEPSPEVLTLRGSTASAGTRGQGAGTTRVTTRPSTPQHTETSPGTVPSATVVTGITVCQPRCEWTEWLDVDFPTSGVEGGDMETFENIRAAGVRLCPQPVQIECRAENYPAVSLDQVGQRVSCSLSHGLECRNADQPGRFNMCFNYNIRLLCCDDRSHCPSTARTSASPGTTTGSGVTTGLSAVTRTVPGLGTGTTPGPRLSTASTPGSRLSTTNTQGPRLSTVSTLRPRLKTASTQGPGLSTTSTQGPRISTASTQGPRLSTASTPGPRLKTTSIPGPGLSTTSTQGPRISTASTQGPRLSTASTQGPRISTASTQGPELSTASTQGPELSTTSTQGPRISTASTQGPRLSTASTQGPRISTASTQGPGFSTASTQGPELSTTSTQGPRISTASTQGPELSTASTQGPRLSTASTQGPGLSTTSTQGPGLSTASTQGPRLSTASTQRPGLSTASTQGPGLSTASTQGPRLSTASTPRPRLKTTSTQGPGLSTASTQRPGLSTASTQGPGLSTTSTQGPELSTASTQGPRLSTVSTQGPELSTASTQGPRLSTASTPRPRLKTTSTQGPGLSTASTQRPGLSTASTQGPGLSTASTQGPELSTASTQGPELSTASTPRPRLKTTSTQGPGLSTASTQRPGLSTASTQGPGLSTTSTQGPELSTASTQGPKLSTASTQGPGFSTASTQGPELSTTSTQGPRISTASTQGPGLSTASTQGPRLSTASTQGPGLSTTSTQGPGLSTASTQGPRLSTASTQGPELSTASTQGPRLSTVSTQGPELSTASTQGPRLSTASTPRPRLKTTSTQGPGLSTASTQRPGLSTASTQGPRLSTSSTQGPRLSTASTQGPGLSTASTQGPGFSTASTQGPGISTASTQGPRISNASTQGPGLSTASTQGPELSTASTQGPGFSTASTQGPGISTASTQGPRISNASTQGPGLSTASTQGPELSTASTQGPGFSTASTQGPGISTASTQGPRISTSSTQGPGLSTASTQGPELSTVSTQGPGFSTASTQGPGISTASTQGPRLSTASTQGPRLKTTGTQESRLSTASTWVPRLSTPTHTTRPPVPPTARLRSTPENPTACQPHCTWTDWLDTSFPVPGESGGDFETYERIRAVGVSVCLQPEALQCRAQTFPRASLRELGQVLTCRLEEGLVCRNRDQRGRFRLCLNYQIRLLCCDRSHCTTSAPAPSTPTPEGPGTTPTAATMGLTSAGQWLTWTSRTSASPGTGPSTQTVTVSTPEIETGLSTLRVTMSTPGTGLSTPRVTVSTPEAGLSTQTVTISTPETGTGPSTPRVTVSTPETETGLSTQRVTVSTPVTGPSTPRVTVSTPETETGLSTQRVTVSTPGTEIGPSTLRVTVSTPGTGLSTQTVTVSTPETETGLSTPRVTVSTLGTETGPSTLRVTVSTPGTGLSTQTVTVSTPETETGLSTQRVIVSTPETEIGLSTQTVTVSTPETETGLSTQRVIVSTPETEIGLSTQTVTVSTPETETGLSTQRVTVSTPETETGPSTLRVTVSTPGTGLSTQTVTVSTPETGLSTQTVTVPTPKTETGLSTLRVTVSTPETESGLSTQTVTVPTPGTGLSTPRVTVSTPETETGPSTLRVTVSTPETETGLSTQRVTVSTPKTETGPSTPRVKVSTPETETGLSTPRVTVSTPETETGLSTQRVTVSTPKTETGPSTPRVKVSTPETETGLSTPRVTVSTPETETGPSTLRVTVSTPEAGLSTPRVTVSTPETETGPSTPSITASTPKTGPSTPRVIAPSPSAYWGTLPTSPAVTPPSGGCRPRCRWTEWLDEDYPQPGPHGGDRETLENLRAAGRVFCEQPLDIECRAQLAPDVPLDALGVVVQCSVELGLLCLNREQPGPFHLCPNFRLRLLCCDSDHCTSPAPGTSGPHSRPSPTPSTPSTPCFCQAFGRLFSPGEVIYNQTDKAGCPFYAICGQHCDIQRYQGPCPTSRPPPPPTAPASTPAPPTSSTPTPSLAPGCDLVDPPRQVNETWTLEDCTVARCEGHNHIELRQPEPVPPIVCASGRQPVKLWPSGQPCDFHYECECFCSGWSTVHFSTFDGTTYSFLDNCTYVLVREIVARMGNLTILLHGHYCGLPAVHGCPRALSIQYLNTEVVLTTRTGPGGQEEGLVLFDQKRVSPGSSQQGMNVWVSASGAVGVDIPAIGLSVAFEGSAFQIQLPFANFSHNTEGQCGTCTNSRADDCRLPDGTLAATCRDMAKSWLVPGEGCGAQPSPPPSTGAPPTAPSASPCPPPPPCRLLLDPVFAACHALVPPGPFFEACVSDGCRPGQGNLPCQSLAAYAAECRWHGLCLDWRNATAGLCGLTCPPGMEYQPCGPVQPSSCDASTQSPVSSVQIEGCFCPEGQTLLNAAGTACVQQCSCVGPDGESRSPGEHWVSGCQACVCEEDSVVTRCQPVQCPTPDQPLECGHTGFVPVSRPRADDPCCSETLCVCNTSTCPQRTPTCRPGEELVRVQEEGDCCPAFECRLKLCEYNGVYYGVGAMVPAVDPCRACTCLSPDGQEPTVHCEDVVCNTTCPQGYKYSPVAGRCCGQCVLTVCVAPNGELVQPNETWVHSHVDNCTQYVCEDGSGVPVLVPRPTPCPDVSGCKGTLRKSGCCYSCEETEDACHVHAHMEVLRHGDCASEGAISLPFCEGSCPGLSRYSPEAQNMQHHCDCCRELRSHRAEVILRCANGTAVRHAYTHVDACGCAPACSPAETPLLP